MGFAHLHVHSEFSLLDGAIKIDQLTKRAAELGQTAVAVTDHGWLAGAVKFVTAAKEAGVKPIVGMETYLASTGSIAAPAKSGGDNFHLTLLAKNEEGYRNLVRLTSIGHLSGLSYKPRIDRSLLASHREGIIVLSGCIGAEIPQTIIEKGTAAGLSLAAEYQRVHGDNFFIEVMHHGSHNGVDHVKITRPDGSIQMEESDLNGELVYIANKLGVGIVATNDAHYLQRDHGDYQDTMLCIGMGAWKEKHDRMRFPGAEHHSWEFYIKSEAEMLKVTTEQWWETACLNSQLVADMIEPSVVKLDQKIMPKFRVPEDDFGFNVWRKTGAIV